jgi:hypothetical protein
MEILDDIGVAGNLVDLLWDMYNKTELSINGVNFFKSSKGLIQGASLSPLLFDIYLDPLVKLIERGGTFVRAFADDIVFILEDSSFLDSKLSDIFTWSRKFDIDVNPLKSGIIRIMKRAGKIKGIPNIMNIREVMEYKYLGIWLNQSLKFDKQISSMKKRCTVLWKKLNACYNPKLKFPARRLLLKCVIFQTLNYGCNPICPVSKKYEEFIEGSKYRFTKK